MFVTTLITWLSTFSLARPGSAGQHSSLHFSESVQGMTSWKEGIAHPRGLSLALWTARVLQYLNDEQEKRKNLQCCGKRPGGIRSRGELLPLRTLVSAETLSSRSAKHARTIRTVPDTTCQVARKSSSGILRIDEYLIGPAHDPNAPKGPKAGGGQRLAERLNPVARLAPGEGAEVRD